MFIYDRLLLHIYYMIINVITTYIMIYSCIIILFFGGNMSSFHEISESIHGGKSQPKTRPETKHRENHQVPERFGVGRWWSLGWPGWCWDVGRKTPWVGPGWRDFPIWKKKHRFLARFLGGENVMKCLFFFRRIFWASTPTLLGTQIGTRFLGEIVSFWTC